MSTTTTYGAVQVSFANETDYDELADIQTRAFEHFTFQRALFPTTKVGDTASIKRIAAGTKEDKENGLIVLKAVLKDEFGEEKIVGAGNLWPSHIVAPDHDPPEGCDVELVTKFFGLAKAKKAEILGDRPHWYIQLIVVHPDFQRRGAGTALVQWAIEQSDKQGTPAYIEASPAGFPLYKRLGFVEKDVVEFSSREGDRISAPCMVREPRSN